MVAKIFFVSTSFLITRLALTPSFSESSLTVMPSDDRDFAIDGRRLARLTERLETRSRRIPSTSSRLRGAATGARLGLMTALLFGRQRRCRFRRAAAWSDAWAACRDDAVRRPGCPGKSARAAGPTHERLTGADRAAIERLTGRGRGTARAQPDAARRPAPPCRGEAEVCCCLSR